MDEQRRRDDVIERELNRAFQTSAAAPAGEPHLDAEAAAAWMDRRLDAGAAQSIEAHLAACGDCQALVSTLARISPAPEEAATAAGGWSWWRRPWLVPAGAAAALAIVVWVSQGQRPAPQPESVQARAEETRPQVRPEESERLPKSRSFQDLAATALGGDAPPPESSIEKSRARPTPTPEQLPSPVGEAPAAPAAADRAANEVKERADLDVSAEQPALDAQAAGKATVAGVAPAAAPPAAPPPAANRQESAASAAPGAFRENARAAASLRAANLTVLAADGTGRWRRAGGSIEFSAGATSPFAAATLPIDAGVLTAGSSPAGTVCWLVGRAGTILVTTDGVRFIRVNPPAASDLVSVAAADALSATVTAADGRRFRTADRGGTWTALPQQVR